MGTFTAEEVAMRDKGYFGRFDNYVDLDEPFLISPENYASLVTWCEPYVARGYEVQGALTFHVEDGRGVVIERVYAMGGKSESFRATCKLDPEDMFRQIQRDYPQRTQLMANEVGWWHLHPGYYPVLSVGDVEECRAAMREQGFDVTHRTLHMLMYGDGRCYQLSAYAIGLEEVNRFPVRIHPNF